MRTVWDEPKRRSNLAKHGLDFGALTEEFFETAVIKASHSERLVALGRLGERLVVAVVFRPLGAEAVSVISMRPASPPERRLHDRHFE